MGTFLWFDTGPSEAVSMVGWTGGSRTADVMELGGGDGRGAAGHVE